MTYSSVYNFYEHLVFDCIAAELTAYTDSDEEFFLDVACYALTRLPARYIRHEIDMAYYLAPGEREKMAELVKEEVVTAAEFIHARQLKRNKEEKSEFLG